MPAKPPNQARQEILRLRRELKRHNRLYYDRAQPEISDQTYDRLLQRLRELENEHPQWASPDSPTQRV
ncbi:MAG: hypothetical protein HGA76_11340, partial [Candidatus Firestonebacteria bacterium]|nr:hypothetical protein [Candidatus Firestonebacteria bacterium]